MASQVAQHALRAADGQTEVHLDPRELGRVTLRMSTEDLGVTLHVTADRSETSELMRRHVSLLQESFRALGYDRIEITINGRQAGMGFGSGLGSGHGAQSGFGTSSGSGEPSGHASDPRAGGAEGPDDQARGLRPSAGPAGLARRDTIDIRV
ncbi:flagellar hook-length control protein FliK [Oceanicola sp. S124]|uniref:flagellar hook-length control protein FliK n=1 Tax=Oceanicola sp. S124 TaxID=1042378 RepID=UPI0002558D55|nr:flagellar hook-length control protein FliK [Oceanicola sp. S124]